jgi:uncharacterized membrane protein
MSDIQRETRGRNGRITRRGMGAQDAGTLDAGFADDTGVNRRSASGAMDAAARRARGLGWFSLGLGLAQVAAPSVMSRLVLGGDGPSRRRTMRAIGLRELAAGVNLLRQPREGRWLWARVAGDVVDLALLGSSFSARKTKTSHVAASLAAVLGVTALDYMTTRQVSRQSRLINQMGARVTRAVTISRTTEEVYRFWRSLPNLARFMEHIESIEVLDDVRSRWKARTPGSTELQWLAEITVDEPNLRIAWRAVADADLPNSGEVRFVRAPAGQGCEVRLSMEFQPPGGPLGAAFAKLFQKGLEYQVDRDLRRCKQVLEVGEVLLSDATLTPGPRPAQPPDDDEFLARLTRRGGE